jgi:hypothetical protein
MRMNVTMDVKAMARCPIFRASPMNVNAMFRKKMKMRDNVPIMPIKSP